MDPRQHPDSMEQIAKGLDRTMAKMGGNIEHKLGILGDEVKALHKAVETLTDAVDRLAQRWPEGGTPLPSDPDQKD